MKNKIKYLLIMMCFMVLPMTVNAHTVSIVEASSTQGETKYGVYIELSSDLKEQTIVKISNCSAGNNISCLTTVGGDGVTSSGLSEDKASGDKFKIGTLTLSSSATSDISGTVTFKITINNTDVTSASGSYTVKAARILSSNSKFKSVTLSQGKVYPEYSTNEFDYTVYNIKDTINSVKINFTCDNCSVSVDEPDNGYNVDYSANSSYIKISDLQNGDNNVTIKVTSEDGSKSDTYTYRIIRGKTDYDSAKISSLTVGTYDLSPEFKSDTTEYSVSVPYSVEEVESLIKIELVDSDAEATFEGASALKVGENTVTINVVSTNGDNEATYTLTVTRLSSTDIIIEKYKNKQITFTNADGEEVTLDEDEFKKQYPSVWEDIEDGKYEFDKDGNIKQEEEETTTETKTDSKKIIIIIAIVVVALIIIVVTGILLFKKKDPEKEAKKKAKKEAKRKAKKEAKRKAKEERRREEAEYYGEEYDDEESDEEETETSDSNSNEIIESDKLNKEEAKSLLEDDYIFTDDSEDKEVESEEKYSSTQENDIVDVDTALEDLMNTKTYDFSDELKDVRDLDDEDDKD